VAAASGIVGLRRRLIARYRDWHRRHRRRAASSTASSSSSSSATSTEHLQGQLLREAEFADAIRGCGVRLTEAATASLFLTLTDTRATAADAGARAADGGTQRERPPPPPPPWWRH
jgi:hypothetical protein